MIRIAIADDDAGMRLVFSKLIERAEGFEKVGEAENGLKMVELFQKEKPQVVVLDVEMPEMDGIACARSIQDMCPTTVIIFATAHEGYRADAFELYAFDYLVKPFKVERALQTLARVKERIEQAEAAQRSQNDTAATQPHQRLMLKHKDGVSFVDLADILLVQREDRMTVIYALDDKRYVVSDALGEFEKRLPQDMFIRTHKSYIVNLRHVDSILPYGRWTYIIKMRGTRQDALITHDKLDELQSHFA